MIQLIMLAISLMITLIVWTVRLTVMLIATVMPPSRAGGASDSIALGGR